MKNWQTIPIPQLMLDLERDPRGFPVPFIVLKDKEGKHHFKINDTEKVIETVLHGLCHICGNPLSEDNLWMVGGPASAFDPNGIYIDGPIHRECGTYALQVCPYMAHTSYNSTLDVSKIQEKFGDDAKIQLFKPTVDMDKVPFHVFLRTRGIKLYTSDETFRFSPGRPYSEVEFWSEGEQILRNEDVEERLRGTKWEKYIPEIYKTLEDA